MEIYTGDLIGIAEEAATKICNELKDCSSQDIFIIEDECCNLQRDIRKVIYERISKEFNDLIDNESVRLFSAEELRSKLFKIINEI